MPLYVAWVTFFTNSRIQTAVQSFLGHDDEMQSVLLSIILYLDKTTVSKHVNKWTVVCRPAFLPAVLRNTSGYTGGQKVGYIPIVRVLLSPCTSAQVSSLRFRRYRLRQMILRRNLSSTSTTNGKFTRLPSKRCLKHARSVLTWAKCCFAAIRSSGEFTSRYMPYLWIWRRRGS